MQTQLQQTKKVPQPENEGPSHTSETLQPTDEEELQHTEEGPRITNEGCQRTEESGPQSGHEGCCKTEKGFQSTDDRTKQTKEYLQPADGEGIKEKDR